MSEPVLVVFVVYRNPRDYPGRYVVRAQRVMRGSLEPVPDPHPVAIVATLDEARAAIPRGLHRLDRHPADDPAIAETWL